MMRTSVLALMLGFTSLTMSAFAQTPSSSPARSAATRLPLNLCSIDDLDEELLCGTLEVYENRKTQSGRKLALNVLVVPSLKPNPTDPPLFFLEGGPGVAATDAVWMFVEDSVFRQTRDIVLVDIRGTGKSNPLHCDLTGDPLNLQNYLNDMYPDSLVIACRESLETIADLTQYTTPIVVGDLDEVRQWLGYDQIAVMGLSYGTRLALTYMRMRPGQVHSAIFIGALAPSVRLPSRHAAAAQRALDLVLDDCENDSACSDKFPRLREDLESLSQELRSKGFNVEVSHPVSGETVSLHIRDEIFFERLRSKMYMITGAREIPWIITRAAYGDFEPFLDLIIPEHFDEPPWLAEGLYLSVTCAEDIPFIDTALARHSYADTYFGDYRVTQQVNAARYWPRGSLPRGYHDSFSSAIPTLIISGVRDPITPPSFASEIDSLLTNCLVVTIPAMAHVPAGMSNSDCVTQIMSEFLRTGSVDSLDLSCVSTMAPPSFRLSK